MGRMIEDNSTPGKYIFEGGYGMSLGTSTLEEREEIYELLEKNNYIMLTAPKCRWKGSNDTHLVNYNGMGWIFSTGAPRGTTYTFKDMENLILRGSLGPSGPQDHREGRISTYPTGRGSTYPTGRTSTGDPGMGPEGADGKYSSKSRLNGECIVLTLDDLKDFDVGAEIFTVTEGELREAIHLLWSGDMRVAEYAEELIAKIKEVQKTITALDLVGINSEIDYAAMNASGEVHLHKGRPTNTEDCTYWYTGSLDGGRATSILDQTQFEALKGYDWRESLHKINHI